MGNYPHQPAVAYLFAKTVNLAFMSKLTSDSIKDVSFAKMSYSFAAAEVLIRVFVKSSYFYHILFTLVPFYFGSWEVKDVPCSFSSY